MLIEYFETDLNLQLIFGLMLGLLFGVAAQISRFCLRRSVAAEDGPDFAGLAVWLTALGVAIFAVQIANTMGFVALEGHRYLAQDIPVLAILAGGLMFGVGMVLTRGCVTRLTVLSATGNLRAVVVLMVFAITAHAMLKGVLSPLRVALGQAAFDVATPSLAVIPGAGFFHSRRCACRGDLACAQIWSSGCTLVTERFDRTFGGARLGWDINPIDGRL